MEQLTEFKQELTKLIISDKLAKSIPKAKFFNLGLFALNDVIATLQEKLSTANKEYHSTQAYKNNLKVMDDLLLAQTVLINQSFENDKLRLTLEELNHEANEIITQLCAKLELANKLNDF